MYLNDALNIMVMNAPLVLTTDLIIPNKKKSFKKKSKIGRYRNKSIWHNIIPNTKKKTIFNVCLILTGFSCLFF